MLRISCYVASLEDKVKLGHGEVTMAPGSLEGHLRSRRVTECIMLGTAVKKCSSAQLCESTEDLNRPRKDQNDLL